jgi:hypothetical protein
MVKSAVTAGGRTCGGVSLLFCAAVRVGRYTLPRRYGETRRTAPEKKNARARSASATWESEKERGRREVRAHLPMT